MDQADVIPWLLDGDVSIQYQVYRDLLGTDKPELRNKIAGEGWGRRFLSCRGPGLHWGDGFYNPKWISSHYTLLDLKNLAMPRDTEPVRETIEWIINHEKGSDGGINPSGTIKQSDVCINGMALNYACYFGAEEKGLYSLIDFLLGEKMDDGGFNCHSNRKGAVHSSLHTTLSVLEGIEEYDRNGYTYRLAELRRAKKSSREFILAHRLYKSDKTGEVINPRFLKLCYPGRWSYDILKALDYFQYAGTPYDKRMDDALDEIVRKRTKEGQWKIPAHHTGQVHFAMEQAGTPSRWNTLRALRVLRKYRKDYYREIIDTI
ncbi:hypothetical protein [Breznakiella homolactica]|uniref:Squalene cyclase C-terminal domain-containing protein n=1 Tax=Breznakiella homolactica TaxID=2798577 RepID=A0A7T7XPB8_9SPIR|nr:hypothetical protein [Breznakiella homolactica]QQO09898.1 hypothetical protein JFL75_03025 [Breznakiella homolactica]